MKNLKETKKLLTIHTVLIGYRLGHFPAITDTVQAGLFAFAYFDDIHIKSEKVLLKIYLPKQTLLLYKGSEAIIIYMRQTRID